MILFGEYKYFAYLCAEITAHGDFKNDMDKTQIGKMIRDRRRSLNVTQPTLAALAGVGLNTLVAVERGDGNPKLDTLVAILDTLGQQFQITLKD